MRNVYILVTFSKLYVKAKLDMNFYMPGKFHTAAVLHGLVKDMSINHFSSWSLNSDPKLLKLFILNWNWWIVEYLFVWQWFPVYPGWQLQSYLLTWSIHVPPLKQGLLEHSSISNSKNQINAWNVNSKNYDITGQIAKN